MRRSLCPECFSWMPEHLVACAVCGFHLPATDERKRELGIDEHTGLIRLQELLWEAVSGRDWLAAAIVAQRLLTASAAPSGAPVGAVAARNRTASGPPDDTILAIAKRVLNEGPADPRRYQLAACLFGEVVERRPHAFAALSGLGIALYRGGRLEHAQSRLLEAYKVEPMDAEVVGYLAWCQYALGQQEWAATRAIGAIVRDPKDPAQAFDVLAQMAKGKSLKLGELEEAIGATPGPTEHKQHAQLVLAELAVMQSDADRALRLLANVPQTDRAWVVHAQALHLKGETEKALRMLLETPPQFRSSVPILSAMAKMQREARQYPEALRTISEIEARDPAIGWRWRLERARILVEMKNPDGAVKVLERVVEEKPGELDPAALLLKTLYYEYSDKDYARLRRWVGVIFGASGLDIADVKAHPERYKATADPVSDIIDVAGYAWLDLPEGSGRAKEAFEAALALFPKWSTPWFGLGLIARRSGNLDEAIRCFRIALDLYPKFRNARSQLVRSLLDAGHSDEASRILSQGLAESPQDEVYLELLDRIRKLGNQPGVLPGGAGGSSTPVQPVTPVEPDRRQEVASSKPSAQPGATFAPILELPDFVRDLTVMAQDGDLEDAIGRDAELDDLIEILCRHGKGNPVILGSAGTGKTALVAGLAHRILRDEVPDLLSGFRVVEVLHAGLRHRDGLVGTLEQKIEQLSQLWARGDVILFADELHVIVGAGATRGHASGGVDQLLKPFLSRPGLRLIGATTSSEYERHIRPDPALERRFTPLTLRPPGRELTARICRFLRNRWVERYHVQVSDEHIDEGIALSERYLPTRNFPDRAIDLLERSCVRASLHKQTEVTSEVLLSIAKSLSHQAELPDFVRDLTLLAEQGELADITGRQAELDELVEVLFRHNKGNPVLVGEAGTGKTALVGGLAHRIVRKEVPPQLAEFRILEVSYSGLARDTSYVGQLESKVEELREIWERSNVILFIDEIHVIVGAGSYRSHESGGLDQLLKPLLTRPGMRLIGATTRAEYDKWIKSDPALERRFTPVVVREPTRAQAIEIGKFLRSRWEKSYSVRLTDEVIAAAVQWADLYLPGRNFPDKAIDLLEKACVKASLHALGSTAVVSRDEVVAALAALASMDVREARRLVMGGGIESRLREKIVSQEDAIHVVSRVVDVARAQMDAKPNRPDGVFILLGPAGTGKRKLCHTLAELLGGPNASPVTIDLSAYGRILEILEQSLKRSPAVVFILLGFAEADPNVQAVFDRIFADGRLQIPGQVDLDFNRCIFAIIDNHDPSHSGAIGFTARDRRQDPRHDLGRFLEQRYTSEVVGVVDAVVEFQPLSAPAVEEVARRQLLDLVARYADRGISFEVGTGVATALAHAVLHRDEGLRALRGLIEDTINRPLAAQVLEGIRRLRAVAQGDTVVIEAVAEV